MNFAWDSYIIMCVEAGYLFSRKQVEVFESSREWWCFCMNINSVTRTNSCMNVEVELLF